MIKGLAITPPILGRISIGGVVEKNGKRLPVKFDTFAITSQVQSKDGWVKHPIYEELLKSSACDKLRSIPVRLLFNEPDLNLRAEYSMFDRQTGRPLCVGNGDTCRRYIDTGVQSLPCPSPDLCELAKGGACKPFGRLNVQIGDEDELGTFIFRTTGFNSIRSLIARLSYYQAISNNLLACLPLELRLRGKSTTMSHRSAIYYVDLTVRDGMTLEGAISQAIVTNARRQSAGYNQLALDAAAREGFKNGAFEEDIDETVAVVEEFYSAPDLQFEGVESSISENTQTINSERGEGKISLLGKLDQKLKNQAQRGNV